MTEQKLTELLRDMSLEEKVNQMSQVTGGFFNGEIVVTGPMADKGFTEDNVNLAGSVIGSMAAETLKVYKKLYGKASAPYSIAVYARCHKWL